jgi:hypothetical protein
MGEGIVHGLCGQAILQADRGLNRSGMTRGFGDTLHPLDTQILPAGAAEVHGPAGW